MSRSTGKSMRKNRESLEFFNKLHGRDPDELYVHEKASVYQQMLELLMSYPPSERHQIVHRLREQIGRI